MSMSSAKFERIFVGLTSAAQKVYEAVPISETWSANKIGSELRRKNIGIDFSIVQGCLNSLIDVGLVVERGRGEFRRTPIRKAAEKQEIAQPTEEIEMQNKPQATKTAAKPATNAAPMTVLDRLGELSQRVAQMSHQLTALSSDITDAAVEIQSQMDANEENIAKVRQLQTLLSSFSIPA